MRCRLDASRCPGEHLAVGDTEVNGEVETEGDSVGAATFAEGDGEVCPTLELCPNS